MARATVSDFLEVVAFSAEAHKDQRRKSGGAYINHPIRVAATLAEVGAPERAVKAALLHDTLEDTEATYEDLVQLAGYEVADIVEELTDNKELPKAERKRLTIEHARGLSLGAKFVKLADLLDNCTGILGDHPPEGWDEERIRAYGEWANKVREAAMGKYAQKGRGVDRQLELLSDRLEAVITKQP